MHLALICEMYTRFEERELTVYKKWTWLLVCDVAERGVLEGQKKYFERKTMNGSML